MLDSMHARDHSDWHRMAASEGVNATDCPFDCTDAPEDGPAPYAWVFNPNLGYEYPVFSAAQARTYARTLAERLGRAVTVRIDRTGAVEAVDVPELPEWVACVHGLSADLCADPVGHYPPDTYED